MKKAKREKRGNEFSPIVTIEVTSRSWRFVTSNGKKVRNQGKKKDRRETMRKQRVKLG